MIPAIIAAIPSIIKLFDSDDRKEGVLKLTNTVVKEASSKLGVKLETKQDVISHLNKNPQDALKLREIEATHLENIMKLKLDDVAGARNHQILLQNSNAPIWVKLNRTILSQVTLLLCFALFFFVINGDIQLENSNVALIVGGALGYVSQILSFFFSSAEQK